MFVDRHVILFRRTKTKNRHYLCQKLEMKEIDDLQEEFTVEGCFNALLLLHIHIHIHEVCL